MEVEALVSANETQPLSSCVKHSEGRHFVVVESGRLAYVSLPQEYAASTENEDLCFTDHRPKDVPNEMCCPKESAHVHAHVHDGEFTKDILLEQCMQCMEESGCALPVLRELSGICQTVLPLVDIDHKHGEDCGHSQISHGDHFDWLVPLKDGSYLLSHPQVQNGLSSFIEHGRLISRGKSLAKLNLRPKLVDLFSYESPKQKGYSNLSLLDENSDARMGDDFQVVKEQLDDDCTIMPSASVGRNVVQGGMMKVDIPADYAPVLCKTTLDVMGICCPSEVPLIKKLLTPLPGVDDVFVNVTAKTVVISHDQLLVSDVQLVKVLNGAHLDASIHQRGELKAGRRWPSPWCLGSGILVAIAFLHYAYEPLKWVGLGAVAVGVPPLILKGIAALRKFVLDINILMLIAVSGAIALGDYVEAGTIVFLFALAEWLESKSTDKARSAIAAVVDRAPQSATLYDSGLRVRVEEVKVGALLSVKTGDTVPIDGEVVSGRGFVDESSLTGESIPVEKELGAAVWAGTINVSGFIAVRTTALSSDSAVARMVRLVEEAQQQRSKTELLVEKIAKYYTPAVVIAAIVIGFVPWAAGVHNPKHWVYLALVLLVVACPCALVISTPVVVTCGIAQAARLGLIVKGGTYLEILGRLKVVAFDKTGTLSEGQFSVSDLRAIDGDSTLQQVLYWVTSVENKASHPLASALVSHARLNGLEPSDDVIDFEVIPGEGVSAVVDGHIVQIGNARMAARLGWDTASALDTLANWSSTGSTVGWIGRDGIAVGIFAVGDQIRPEAAEAVRDLRNLGIRVAMLTGDSSAAAGYAHDKIGEIDVHAELLPEDKVRIVQELKEHGIIAMVGDGINDAPALAAADLGIAMGVAGSAVAMETADVALMTNDLRKIASATRLGLDCRWKIGQNVTFSFVTKLLIIGLAAGGYASLWGAVVADVGTCLLVIFNSMRILKKSKRSHGSHQQCISHKLHHHDKKEKCEEDALCCAADKESQQPPCCSSARCEMKVLTSRNKGHNRTGHGFEKTKGVKKSIDLCESFCCNDTAAIAQPKAAGCGSSKACCSPKIELVQKAQAAETGTRCCSDVSCTDRLLEGNDPDDCCTEGSCKSPPKAYDPLTSIPRGCEEHEDSKSTTSGCCSTKSCKAPPNKRNSAAATDSMSSAYSNDLSGEKKAVAGCCSKESCKAPPNKRNSAAATDSISSAYPNGGKKAGCCSNGSCKAPRPSKRATETCKDDCCKSSELGAAPSIDDSLTSIPRGCEEHEDSKSKTSGCCSTKSCEAPPNKMNSAAATDSMSSAYSNDLSGGKKAVTGCCSKESCKAPPNKRNSAAATDSISSAYPNGGKKAGCCSNGSCKAPRPSTRATETCKDDCCKSSELGAAPSIDDPLTSIPRGCEEHEDSKSTTSECCSTKSCKSPPNKRNSAAATDSISSAYPNDGKKAGCCSNGSCKAPRPSTRATDDCCKSSELGAAIHRTSEPDLLPNAASPASDSCCADPSKCKSCVVSA